MNRTVLLLNFLTLLQVGCILECDIDIQIVWRLKFRPRPALGAHRLQTPSVEGDAASRHAAERFAAEWDHAGGKKLDPHF